jgi:hypothetical protein
MIKLAYDLRKVDKLRKEAGHTSKSYSWVRTSETELTWTQIWLTSKPTKKTVLWSLGLGIGLSCIKGTAQTIVGVVKLAKLYLG